MSFEFDAISTFEFDGLSRQTKDPLTGEDLEFPLEVSGSNRKVWTPLQRQTDGKQTANGRQMDGKRMEMDGNGRQ